MPCDAPAALRPEFRTHVTYPKDRWGQLTCGRMYSSYSRWSGVLKSSRAMTKMDANPPRGAANSQAGTGPLLLSAQSTEQAVRRKLRAGLGLRGSPAAGRRPILGHGRVGRQGGWGAPPSKLANSVRALPSAPLPVPHTDRCTAPLATSSPEGSAQAQAQRAGGGRA